jgi:hypothetical protein
VNACAALNPSPGQPHHPQLLRSGRTVVAAVRTADKASEVFSALELQEGRQAEGKGDGILFVQAGVDVTDESTLTPDLFAGVTQVRMLWMTGGLHAARMPHACVGTECVRGIVRLPCWCLLACM